jgi:biopolymer transport protein ExbD
MAGNRLQRGGIIEGINVTPLVDVTLVLLVIFIVTAKIIVTPAIPLDLPQASQSDEVQTVFAVSLEPDGGLHVDGSEIELSALHERAVRALVLDSELRAVIRADEAVSHGRVMQVLDTLRAAGLSRVAFAAATPESVAAAGVGP